MSYANVVACPKCGAQPDRSCTFKHFATGQKIETFYCRERHQAHDAVVAAARGAVR